MAFTAKKGINYKGAPKGTEKDQGGKWGGNGGKAGTTGRISEISGAKVGSSVGTGPTERASGRRA